MREKMLITNQVSTYELDDDAVFVGHQIKNEQKPVLEETKSSPADKKQSRKGMFSNFKNVFKGKQAYQPPVEKVDAQGTEKHDWIWIQQEKEIASFDPLEFFERGDLSEPLQSTWVMTEVYYQARFEALRGILTLKQDHMSFMGHNVDFAIDYLDIVSANKL